MKIPDSKYEVILSVLAYSLCSGSLVLINKITLHNLPYPSMVVSFQLVAALLFIWGAKWSGKLKVDDIKIEYVIPYLYYIVAFSFGVYCNMKSLSLSNVETVVVFRALSPCLVSFLDVFFLGREYPSVRSWCSLLAIALGAYGYASCDEQFQTQGLSAYFWPLLYLLIICFEMVYGKRIIQSVDLKTRSGPVLYTNLLGLPPMLAFAAMGKEYSHFHRDHIVARQPISLGVWLLLVMGCVAGTAIGYSSWWCRDNVSATSFTLIGVINKCLTIFLNCIVWDKHASPRGLASLLVCLVGGTFYQQAPLRSKEKSLLDERATEDEEIDDQDVGPDEEASLLTNVETERKISANFAVPSDNMNKRRTEKI